MINDKEAFCIIGVEYFTAIKEVNSTRQIYTIIFNIANLSVQILCHVAICIILAFALFYKFAIYICLFIVTINVTSYSIYFKQIKSWTFFF